MRHRRNPVPEHLRYPRSGFLDEFDDTPPTSQVLAEQDRNCDNETYENLDLRHISFYEASLVNTKFINCDLRECRFLTANCENATFKECDLSNSHFRYARLNGSNFELSDLRDASLVFSQMPNLEAFDRANIEGTQFTDVALFLAYLRYRKGELPDLNLIGVPQFTSLPLMNSDLQGADLKGMVVKDSYFVRADLQDANLSEGDFYGSNFPSANLSRANLSNADLRFTNLSEAKLSGANLIGAKYNNKTFGLTESQKALMIEVD